MNTFRIVPLSLEYVNNIKTTQKDEFGNEVIELLATGKGPCRISLKPFEVGRDKRLLFKHSPFQKENAFNQPGPIFIHKEDIEPYSDIFRFPPEIKADKEHFPLSLIGYDSDQRMIFSKLVGDQDIDELINKVFTQQSDIQFLHARNSEACCYICKIERINP
jgi:hypothetical protein